jgi:hypothetical protein
MGAPVPAASEAVGASIAENATAPVEPNPPAAQTPAADDSLLGEVALLRDARAALAAGAAARALRVLDAHAAKYPHGALLQERLSTRILALCAMGRIAEARSAAAAFERAFPSSPHRERIRASCGGVRED